MNEEIKARWINALLSGEYKQGEGALRSSRNEYCCLGVLCDLYSKETGVRWRVDPWGLYAMHSSVSTTPNEVDRWAGFTASVQYNPETDGGVYSILTELADLNDDGDTFEQIVEVIKEKL